MDSKYIKMALDIATTAHEGQLDKGGHPYIEHPVAVASFVKTDEEKTVAYLHDVVEDTNVTLADLAADGFPEEIVTAVDAISQRDGESDEDYIERVKLNDLALHVKIADLKHNSDLSRFEVPTEKDIRRSIRYTKIRRELMDLCGETDDDDDDER